METRHHQHYALDEQGNLVHISNTSPGERYYCVSCGEEMVSKKGKKNEHHFAHKKDTPHCSSETYLHNLAKRRIAEWFVESEEIYLRLNTFCKKYTECRFRSDFRGSRCVGTNQKYNLKSLFEFVGIEVAYGGLVPDILLQSKEKKQPLFVEIFVSHPCSVEKRNSGYRIIEFAINSEQDIDRIVDSIAIEEGHDARLYGFKNPTEDVFCIRSVGRITIYKSGKLYADEVDLRQSTPQKSALCQILIPVEKLDLPDILPWATNVALRHGFQFKNCYICNHSAYNEYLNDRICMGYKRFHIPRECSSNNANTCFHFFQRPGGAEYMIGNPDICDYTIEDCRQDDKKKAEDNHPQLNFGE